MRRTRLLGAAVALVLVASCSSGDSIVSDGDDKDTTTSAGSSAGDTTAPAATTTTVAADTLPDCPTGALADATGTVDLTFWHGMSGTLDGGAASPHRRLQLQPVEGEGQPGWRQL